MTKAIEDIMSKLGTKQKGGIYSKYPTISKNLMGGKGLEVKHKCSRFDIQNHYGPTGRVSGRQGQCFKIRVHSLEGIHIYQYVS